MYLVYHSKTGNTRDSVMMLCSASYDKALSEYNRLRATVSGRITLLEVSDNLNIDDPLDFDGPSNDVEFNLADYNIDNFPTIIKETVAY